MASFLFIDPAKLAGGKEWYKVCDSIESETARELLGCNSSIFVGFFKVIFLMLVYGYILYNSSNLISDGSELLLLVPSLRNVVGSVVLPTISALPDGALILFSALGENAQEEVAVGVGALAGSSIMLLTIPWFMSILGGRVSILPDGTTNYKRPANVPKESWTKLYDGDKLSWDKAGVEVHPSVKHAGKLLLLTSLSYLIIQIPAIMAGTTFVANETPETIARAAEIERKYAAIGIVVCICFFVYYLYEQVRDSQSGAVDLDDKLDIVRQAAIADGKISLSGAFYAELLETAQLHEQDVEGTSSESARLLKGTDSHLRLRNLLRMFFNSFDHDSSGTVDINELQALMLTLNERVSKEDLADLYKKLDKNQSGTIDFEEFCDVMPSYIMSRAHVIRKKTSRAAESAAQAGHAPTPAGEENRTVIDAEDEEEVEDVPEELQDKDPQRQLRKIMTRSFGMMLLGATLVLIFSDPMVDVLGEVGFRLGISPFYISFVLAPLASNASELLATYKYSMKKTKKTITISFATLLGGVIMNNSFCLLIFLVIIYMKKLAWTFTAETLSILAVEIVAFFISQKKVQTVRTGLLAFSMFPASLLMVYILENVFGLD